MVLTRSQVKARAVNAALVASPGVHSPLSQRTNLQGNAVVADTNNDLGGDHVKAAWGGDVDDVNTGFILGSTGLPICRRTAKKYAVLRIPLFFLAVSNSTPLSAVL